MFAAHAGLVYGVTDIYSKHAVAAPRVCFGTFKRRYLIKEEIERNCGV